MSSICFVYQSVTLVVDPCNDSVVPCLLSLFSLPLSCVFCFRDKRTSGDSATVFVIRLSDDRRRDRLLNRLCLINRPYHFMSILFLFPLTARRNVVREGMELIFVSRAYRSPKKQNVHGSFQLRRICIVVFLFESLREVASEYFYFYCTLVYWRTLCYAIQWQTNKKNKKREKERDEDNELITIDKRVMLKLYNSEVYRKRTKIT